MDADTPERDPDAPRGKIHKPGGFDPFEMAALDRMALELRRDGYSYPQIAEKMGSPVSTAHKRVQRGMRQIIAEPAAAVRTMELARLDHVLEKTLAIVDNEKASFSERLQALGLVLRTSESRRKLEGLDAPTKVEHRVLDAMDARIEALAAELAALDEPVDTDAGEALEHLAAGELEP